MSTRALTPPMVPGLRWWLILAVVIATGMLVHWAIAAGVLVLLLVQMARPLDFFTSFLLVVIGAAMVFNEGGGMTSQLGLLSAAVLAMLACYALSMPGRVFSLPRSSLTLSLFAFIALTLLNAVRGIQGGSPAKNVSLELMPLLGLGSALLLANVFDARRDLRLSFVVTILIGYGVAIWGLIVFSITRAHIIGFYSMAIPGLVGLLLINLALRSTNSLAALAWITLSIPLFVHQFITFGRGLWTGCIAGLALSILTFAGAGRGSAIRWRRVGFVLVVLIGFALVGVLQAAILFQQSNLLEQAWARFSTIGSVDTRLETRSNVIRLWEYRRAFGFITQSPLFGYGLGFTFTLSDPFSGKISSQWGLHQNFLLIWLKQGVVGLLLFIWMLWAAIVLGVREARRRLDPLESSWFANSAAATIFLVAFSLSNFPFARVNETFFLAMFWGVSMAMTRKGLVSFRWAPQRSDGRGEAA